MKAKDIDFVLEKNDIVEASFTIDDSYTVKMGDERFYQLIGDNTLYTFDNLMHPEDVDDFKEFIASEDYSKPLLARCLSKGNRYRLIVLTKIKKRTVENSECMDLEIQDILAICNHFDDYYNRIKKYRAMMNMMEQKFFEYDYKTGIFEIYCYVNNRSEMIEKAIFDEWRTRVINLGYIEDEQMERFNSFCNNVKSGMDSYSVTLDTSIISRNSRRDKLKLQGQTLYKGNERSLTIGVITEITGRLQQTNIQYENEEVNKDSGTGILNKKTVTNMITADINMASEMHDSNEMYLCILDIDNFKMVNDTYGHYFGDEVIREFADALQRAVGDRGIVGRIGGDEFIALVKEAGSEEELRIMLKSMRKTLKLRLQERQPGYMFTTSIGVAHYPKDGTDYEKLFKIADSCLYIAKEKGKDRYIIYDRNKHGDIISDNLNSHKMAVGNDFMKPIEKCEYAAKLMMRLAEEKDKFLPELLDEIMDKFNIHGISIFTGTDMKMAYMTGHYNTRIDNAEYILNDQYIKLFKEHNINVVNNVASLAIDYKTEYEILKQNNICSFVQAVSYNDGKPVFMMQFDIFGENRRKWSEIDINVLKMLFISISDIMNKEILLR